MFVFVFGECEIVVVAMTAMPERHPCRERVRLRYFFDALKEIATIDEAEGLRPCLAASRGNGHVRGRPTALVEARAPPGRHAVLEDLKPHRAVAGINRANLILAVMMMVIVRGLRLLVRTRAPDHPETDAEHDNRGAE